MTGAKRLFAPGDAGKPAGDHIDATDFVRQALPALLDAATDRAATGGTISGEEAQAILKPWADRHPEMADAIGRRIASTWGRAGRSRGRRSADRPARRLTPPRGLVETV